MLIKCVECEKEISDTVQKCPHCGITKDEMLKKEDDLRKKEELKLKEALNGFHIIWILLLCSNIYFVSTNNELDSNRFITVFFIVLSLMCSSSLPWKKLFKRSLPSFILGILSIGFYFSAFYVQSEIVKISKKGFETKFKDLKSRQSALKEKENFDDLLQLENDLKNILSQSPESIKENFKEEINKFQTLNKKYKNLSKRRREVANKKKKGLEKYRKESTEAQTICNSVIPQKFPFVRNSGSVKNKNVLLGYLDGELGQVGFKGSGKKVPNGLPKNVKFRWTWDLNNYRFIKCLILKNGTYKITIENL